MWTLAAGKIFIALHILKITLVWTLLIKKKKKVSFFVESDYFITECWQTLTGGAHGKYLPGAPAESRKHATHGTPRSTVSSPFSQFAPHHTHPLSCRSSGNAPWGSERAVGSPQLEEESRGDGMLWWKQDTHSKKHNLCHPRTGRHTFMTLTHTKTRKKHTVYARGNSNLNTETTVLKIIRKTCRHKKRAQTKALQLTG